MMKSIGTLLPVFALKSNHPTCMAEDRGTFATAYLFMDWLKKTRQTAWQVLPLHQTQLVPHSSTHHIPCPYKGYGIGLDPKFLPLSDVPHPSEAELEQFRKQNAYWLETYALFCSLRDRYHTDDWREWPEKFRDYHEDALKQFQQEYPEELSQYYTEQWQLHTLWNKVRDKAQQNNIKLIGDLSFYLSLRSPLVWKYKTLFELDNENQMIRISGVPDFFGRQAWGHPLYRFESEEVIDEIINLWKLRIRYMTQLFHMIRFDHAQGLFYYGALDPEIPEKDVLVSGPGFRMFEELYEYAHSLSLKIFVEDVGDYIDEIRQAIHTLHISGMRIFRYGIHEKDHSIHLEHAATGSYPVHTVAYTTNHDTEPLVEFLREIPEKERKKLAECVKVLYTSDIVQLAQLFVQAVINSPAEMSIIQFQDWIGSTERINIPGTGTELKDTNWQYRMEIPIEELPLKLW